ncbi:VIT domain-containing protein, partial [Pseudomonadota bacterium]
MWIDGQPVTGEVLEQEQARQLYEEEKAAGRDAGITEKNSYRTFETRVSPVRAGQDTRLRLVYLQPAEVDTGIGRYVYPLEEGGVDEEKLAFW